MNRLTRVYGVVNVVYGLTLGLIVLEALPERYLPVDAMGGLISLLLLGSGLGLLMHAPWALRAGQLAAAVHLLVGAILLGAIVMSIGFLHGIYGAIGQGGTAVLLALLALLLPYFLVLPVLEILHLRGAAQPRP